MKAQDLGFFAIDFLPFPFAAPLLLAAAGLAAFTVAAFVAVAPETTPLDAANVFAESRDLIRAALLR